MLVLTRKLNEQIDIGVDVRVTVVEIRGGRVKLGIDAPTSVNIARTEVSRTHVVLDVKESGNAHDHQKAGRGRSRR